MPNGFANELKKWNEQLQGSIDRLTFIESEVSTTRKKAEEPVPWWQKVLQHGVRTSGAAVATKMVSAARGVAPPTAFTPELWAEKPIEEKLQEESAALTDYNRAAWFSVLYSGGADDFNKAGITSFEDYIEKHPPEAGTSVTDLSRAKEYVDTILAVAEPTKPTPDAKEMMIAEGFLTEPLETRPRFKGIHITTVEEMTKWLKKEVPPVKLPAGLTEGGLLDHLKEERGLSDEELADIDSSVSPWIQMVEEYEAGREQTARYKAGLETPEMPEMTVGERIKFIASQPVLAVLDTMQPYWTHWDYPRSAIITRFSHRLGNISRFPITLPGATPTPEEESLLDELDTLYEANREAGMDYWTAHGKAWQDWELNNWAKMGIEVITDPVSYLGFGFLIKAAKATKGIPVIGRIMGGLGSFERGFITVSEAPFTLLKSKLMKLPKTTGQRAGLAGAEVSDTIVAVQGKSASGLGKTFKQITPDDFVKLNEQGINRAITHPNEVSDLTKLGWAFTKRTPMTHDGLLEWGTKVGSKLGIDDITPGMVETLESILEHTKIKGSKFWVNNLDDAAKRILQGTLEVADSPANMKIVKKLIRDIYKNTIDDALKTARLPISESIKVASTKAEKVIWAEATEKIFLKRMHQGYVAGIMHDVLDPLETQIWRGFIDKKVVMPFARAYLITGSYAPWNWFEEVFRTVFGRGGGIYGKNAPARLENLAIGLMFDKDVIKGAGLAKMSYTNILKKRLLKPGAATGVGELSEAALLKEVGEEVGKPALEKLLLLGWLPGGKGRAVHEAMYFPIRASQWSGGMQRSGYVAKKFFDNLDDMAPDAMVGIRGAKPPKPPTVIGQPRKSQKAFLQRCDDNSLLGPTKTENTPKEFSTRNTSLAEGYEASLKYPELSNTRDFILSRIETDNWDNIPLIAGEAKDMMATKLIDSPEGSRVFLKNLTDDLLKGAKKIDTMDELIGYVHGLEAVSSMTPETIQKLFVGLQAKASRLPSKAARIEMNNAGYKSIAPFLDEGEIQANRLLSHIKKNMKGVLTPAQIDEVNKSLTTYMGRIKAIQDTRRLAMTRSQELIAEGVGPGTEKFVAERNAIWMEYFNTIDPKLFAQQRMIAEGTDSIITPRNIPKPTINASVRGLTPADVAALHYGTGDQLAFGLMNSEALMQKPYFMELTISRADAMALRANTTRGALGFTDDAIGQVYDQVIYGLRSSPEFHNMLTRPYAEMDNFAMDLESIKLAGGTSPDAMKAMQEYATTYANNLRKLDIYKPAVPTKPPAKLAAPLTRGDVDAINEALVHLQTLSRGEIITDAKLDFLTEMLGSAGIDTKAIRKLAALSDKADIARLLALRLQEVRDVIVRTGKFALPVKPPAKPPVRLPGEGSEEWWKIKQDAMDKTMISYHQDFTDYSNMNALDDAARHVFPYWVYESQRWFWLARNFVTHPGVMNTWAKYMDNSDFGYIHMPGTSLDVNVLRGTVYKGGMSTLVRRDYPEYYDRMFPELFETMDYSQRLGFFPNIFWSIPVSMYGGRQPQFGQLLPVVARTPLDIYVMSNPDSESAKALQDILFPDYFRQYLQITQASHMASVDQIQRGVNGVYIWEKMQRSEDLTTEEQELWAAARGKVASYAPLMEHGGIYRLRHEDRIAAYDLWSKFLEEKTGVSVEMQDDLRKHGMSIGDVCPGLSQLDMAQIEEALEYKRWIAPRATAPLRPSNEIEVNLILSEFWGMVRQHGDDSESAIRELERQAFVERSISAEDYVTKVRSIMEDNANYIHQLRGDKFDHTTGEWEANPQSKTKFKIVPVTLDERSAFYAERGVNLSMSTLDEMLAMWYDISPQEKTDPETGARYMDWGTYFATMDAIERILPTSLKGEWQSYMSRNNTPGWLMHRNVTKQYLAPYWNVTNVIKEQFTPEEQSLIDEYYMIRDINPSRAVEIQDMTRPNGLKLISQYTSALTNARKKLRMSVPMVDAQLMFWGRTTTFLTPEAEMIYNQLVQEAKRFS